MRLREITVMAEITKTRACPPYSVASDAAGLLLLTAPAWPFCFDSGRYNDVYKRSFLPAQQLLGLFSLAIVEALV